MPSLVRTYAWPKDRRKIAVLWQERGATLAGVDEYVRGIVDDVRSNGDAAVCRYAAQFDKVSLTPGKLELKPTEIERGLAGVPKKVLKSLRVAARNIAKFHKQDGLQSWEMQRPGGVRMGKRVTPLDRVGVYVPGGKAVYPSTVLMDVIPAKVAGVGEICVFSPPDASGQLPPVILAAAAIAGADRIFRIGGVQAIAACAFGTKHVPRVDKIVGPGNKYVAAAKRLVYGQVDIDSIAGPSEVVILADDGANPLYAAAEMLAQAEHDEDARAVLITPSRALADAVAQALPGMIDAARRRDIIRKALTTAGAIVTAPSMNDCIDLVNDYAPEHLQILTEHPRRILRSIRHAGAIFLGPWSPVALGDYFAGPNHVLPTGGGARFSSPLGVKDFVKESSVLAYTRKALEMNGAHIIRLAESEALFAHAETIKVRMLKKD